jgi:hypothetical protein
VSVNNGSSNSDGEPLAEIKQNPPGPYPLGTTTVKLTVTNALDFTDTCYTRVIVVDHEAPVITCPADPTFSTDPGLCSATRTLFQPNVTDNCENNLSVPEIVGTFNEGKTQQTYSVTDSKSNSDAGSSCTFFVIVEDHEAPSASCEPANNPAGKEPNANNQDGFFVLDGDDNCAVWEIYVVDSASGHRFGPYDPLTTFKYIEAPGAPIKEKVGTGDVDYRLTGNGDAYVLVIDTNGNEGTADCLVPPPPARRLHGEQ